MIEFYLQADECLKKNPVTKEVTSFLAVREYYQYEGPLVKNKKGAMVPSLVVVERVNETIKANFPKEYKAFSEYLQKNEAGLYESALAQPGKPLKIELTSKVLEPIPQEEEKNGHSKKKSKKAK